MTTTGTPIDGTAEEIPTDTGQPQPTTAVARRERRSEVIRPLNADALVASFSEYQELLPKLLDGSDYQDAGRGKRFVKKSGWRKIATAFDLDVQIVRSAVERDEHGGPQRAEVWARAIAPSGRAMDGDGYCSVDESRFSGPQGNKSKLENDLRATATTRAMNRAISGLVGMGEVSAEEVDAGAGQSQMPAWTQPASAELAETLRMALVYLFGDPSLADEVRGKLTADTDGELVGAVGRAVVMAISAYKKAAEVGPEPPADPSVGEQASLETPA